MDGPERSIYGSGNLSHTLRCQTWEYVTLQTIFLDILTSCYCLSLQQRVWELSSHVRMQRYMLFYLQ